MVPIRDKKTSFGFQKCVFIVCGKLLLDVQGHGEGGGAAGPESALGWLGFRNGRLASRCADL
jgi:hypothetical protein